VARGGERRVLVFGKSGPVHWVVLCIEKVWRGGGREQGGREGGGLCGSWNVFY